MERFMSKCRLTMSGIQFFFNYSAFEDSNPLSSFGINTPSSGILTYVLGWVFRCKLGAAVSIEHLTF